MEDKMLHIYKDIYACCADYLNWIPYKKCKITKAEYEKMTPKKQVEFIYALVNNFENMALVIDS